MRGVISSIAKKIANNSFAAGLAVTILGVTAYAGKPTIQHAQEEMNKGKDYAAAWEAATRATGPAYSPKGVAKIKKAESELMQGKDYVAAWEAASRSTVSDYSPEQIAKAKLAESELMQGKDYVAAWEAAAKARPTPVRTSRSGDTARERRNAVK